MKFVDIMKRMSAMDQLLYPEGLGVMYFVNAPFLFSGPWKAIRGLMAEVPPPPLFPLGFPAHRIRAMRASARSSACVFSVYARPVLLPW